MDLQLFGTQEPEIPEELQGLPNKDIVKEIMEEEGLVESQDAETGEQVAETKEEVAPEQKPDTKPEDLEFWRKKAEQMERAMYEERDKRKQERDKREEAERQLLYRLNPQPEPEEDPLAQEVNPYIKKAIESDPTLKEAKEYIEAQKREQETYQHAMKSQEAARQRYNDFDDITAPVIKAAEANRELAQLILYQPDPAEFAYTLGIRAKFEEVRKAEKQKQVQKVEEIAKHPKAGQVKGASVVNAEDLDPDTMTTDEWDTLDPKLKRKLLMGG